MIPVEVLCVLSPLSGSPGHAVGDLLGRFENLLRTANRDLSDVLAMTFFADATDADSYRGARQAILADVREAYGATPPPLSVVAQPPEGGRPVALEAAVLASRSDDIRISRRLVGDRPYTVLERVGLRQVYGCVHSAGGRSDPVAQSEEVCAGAEAILAAEGMTWGHVVRQWNYLEDVLEVQGSDRRDHQVYQAFNDVRTKAYAGSSFPTGYPASTGIGQASGGVIIDFMALSGPPDVRVAPITNPKQIDAHRYSESVLVGDPLDDRSGKTSPKFERAKSVTCGHRKVVFVSGTAAILGEESVAPGDVVEQTRTTIQVISPLVSGEKLTHLRAYVKRTADIPAVREVCETAYGCIPALYVTADICREELLVEIEGSLVTRGSAAGAG